MRFTEGEVYHIYNRGNNRQQVFFEERNYVYFINSIRKHIAPACDILGWCLMPNHFHLLIRATDVSCITKNSFSNKEIQNLSGVFGTLLSAYSKSINKSRGTTGSLFQQHTKAKSISLLDAAKSYPGTEAEYLLHCLHYIHQNPVRAGICSRLEEWPFSSFKDYCGMRNGTLCKRETLMAMVVYDWEHFYNESYLMLSNPFDGNT